MSDIKPGLYRMSMADYLADPCAVPSISSGCAYTLITQSPLHARHEHPRLNRFREREASEASDMGSIVHALLLEGRDDGLVAIDAPDWRTKAAKEARDAARAEGKHPILAHRVQDVRAMLGAARDYIASSELAGVFDDGESELTMIWQEGDVWCRARPDWLTTDRSVLLHYKTTQGSAEPESFTRGMLIGMGYDMAAAFYDRGLYAVARPRKSTTVFLVQECSPPYACSLIALSGELQDMADAKVSKAIALWDRCMKSGFWPAYPNRICYAEPPAWAQKAWEERQAAEETYDPELATQA